MMCLIVVAQAQDEAAIGTWHGAIEIPGSPLEVRVNLQLTDAWQGTIDIPAQGAVGLPLGGVEVDGAQVRFAIAGVPGDPTFEGILEEDSITGSFTQAGQQFPFSLEREDAAAAPAPEDRYLEPQGRFSVPVPTNWTVTQQDGYAVLSGPEAGLTVYVLALEEDDLEAAVAEGWALVDPDFTLEPDDVLEPPSQAGVERTIVVNYDPDDANRVYQGYAQLHDGTAYLMLFDLELAAVQRRAAQLQILSSGFRIEALDEADLSGIEPLPVSEVVGELETFIEENLEAFGIPGVAVAIVQGDEVVYAQGFGVTEEGGERITPDTHMMIGSTGKTMTTMLMAALVDAGLMDWDTPVVEVLPEFAVANPELTEQITIRNLVCACTGVPRRDFELFFNADELDAEAIVRSLATFEFFTDFGEAFQYSNQLVGTGGYAAAAADGADFGELYEGYASSLQTRILGPIGMENTTLSFGEVQARGQYATPHQRALDSGFYTPIPLEAEKLLSPIAPAGAHWSTANDMTRYLITQLNIGIAPDGIRVVSEANLTTTWEPQVPISATDSYGLGWIVSDYRGLLMLSHGGNTLGFTSDFAFLPEANLGVVVLTNAQGSNAFNAGVRGRLLELVFEQAPETEQAIAFTLAQTQRALTELQEQLQDTVDVEAVTPYLGRYTNPALGEVTLSLEDGRLMIDAGEFVIELRATVDSAGEPDGYLSFDQPFAGLPFELEEDEAGNPTIRLGSGAVSYTFTRVD